ncbi:MAG TPA: hypothetical protein PLK30_22180 [Blastocatellia bacterium]|nr:hypothetical protein [Blastocatellia bacterium]
MAAKTAVIRVDPDLAEAYNSAPPQEQTRLKAVLRTELRLVRPSAVPRLSKKESELFLKINACLPDERQERFDELTAKRRQDSLTKSERAELLQLAEESEQLWVERIRAITELAKLRRTTPDELMDRLGIPRRRYE